MFTQLLSDDISINDSVNFKGAFSLEARSIDTTLQGGATYLISPNPFTGTGTLSVSDGDGNDSDPAAGIIAIDNSRFDNYLIEITTIPATFDVTINATSAAIWNAEANPLLTFTLISQSATVINLDPLIATTAPLLNATHTSTLEGFNAVIINQTQSSIDSTDDLSEIIAVGENNTSGISDAITQQSNLKLITTIAPGTSGTSIQSTIGMPTYALPSDDELTTVLPVTVIQDTAGTVSTKQTVCSPAYKSVIPGQTMILPVEDSLIPTFGGVSELELSSSGTSSSTGSFNNDFTCIEVDDEVGSNPTLASSGITNQLELFINVMYRYEEGNVGFNWGDENNINGTGKLTTFVPIPTDSNIITLANGCADVQAHTLDSGTWTGGIDTVISNIPSTTKSGFCEVEIESTHYSKKSVSSKRSASSSSGDSSSGSSGGNGRTGVSTGYSGGFGGFLSTPLAINEIYYDKCTENMAKIIVSSDADAPPTVRISTAKSGVVIATLSAVQPYAELNEFSSLDRYVYEIPIASDESFLMVVATEEKGTTTNTVQASVKLLSCEGTTVIVPLPDVPLPEVSEDAPKFFDTKLSIEDGTTYDATESEFLYIDGQDMSVSAIIDSVTTPQRVEIRAISMGQTVDQYVAIKMDVTPLQISNSTYIVSGTIPSYLMAEPGMTYWMHITGEDDSQSESIHYNIGVKPTESSTVHVEVDIPTIKPSGTIVKPEFYIFNDDAPSYGIVSLMVDGKVVSKQSQLFGTGQTHVIFNWNIPQADGYVDYDVQGMVELYNNTFATASSTLATHPKTITVTGEQMPELQVIQRDGTVLADPALVYASNADDTLRFTVTDPAGQCIIGSGEECLVNDSTRDNRGGLESVPYGDQILRVRYSGADNALERFSITSIDPIVGQWNVTLESDDGFVQQAHASENTVVKIKYRYHSETTTVKSE